MNLDILATIIATPILLFIAFLVGSATRGILVKDEYKPNTAAMIINIVIGIVTLIILGKAFR